MKAGRGESDGGIRECAGLASRMSSNGARGGGGAGPLFAAAVAVAVLGGYAFASAPPEANKITAVAIPGVIAAVFVGLGIGVHVRGKVGRARGVKIAAGVVALLFAGLVAFPAVMRTQKMTNWPTASAEWQRAVQQDPSLGERAAADRSVRKAFFNERNSPDHDQRYLVITLWSMTAVCVLTALTMVGRGRRSAERGEG